MSILNEHLYFNGQLTRLEAGDEISHASGSKFVFYRGDRRLIVGNQDNTGKDDCVTIFNQNEFFTALSIMTGLKVCITKSKDMELKRWVLQSY
jgi:hypothetical protein